MKLSVAVPCYNEAQNLPLILNRFAEVVRREDVEVILVDNGSSDRTDSVLRELLPRYRFARTVRVEVNQGYGYGILTGLRAAKGAFIGWTHADLQTDPGDCLRALQMIEGRGGPEDIYIKGLRRGRPLFDRLFTVGMSLFESAYLGGRFWDINAQPNIFHQGFFDRWKDPPHDFSLDLYALYLARKEGLTLVRMDVRFPPRLHGESKWNTSLAEKWKFIRRTVAYSVKLRRELSS